VHVTVVLYDGPSRSMDAYFKVSARRLLIRDTGELAAGMPLSRGWTLHGVGNATSGLASFQRVYLPRLRIVERLFWQNAVRTIFPANVGRTRRNADHLSCSSVKNACWRALFIVSTPLKTEAYALQRIRKDRELFSEVARRVGIGGDYVARKKGGTRCLSK